MVTASLGVLQRAIPNPNPSPSPSPNPKPCPSPSPNPNPNAHPDPNPSPNPNPSQAFTNPAALCALGRIVPPQNRATVNGAYSSAVYLGGGLAALSVLIDAQLGWRGLSYLAGELGVGSRLGSGSGFGLGGSGPGSGQLPLTPDPNQVGWGSPSRY